MMEPKPFPYEMQRLRDMLDKRGIEWSDRSDDRYEFWYMSEYASYGYDRIWRTRFDTVMHSYSVICGYGTYGREYDLLECMVDSNEPEGDMTADDVMSLVDAEPKR